MKVIIIDGVNVAECQYFNKVFNEEPYCNIDEEHLYTCSSEPNCYFKQLQHLKQENEELKKYQYTQEYLQSEIEKRQQAIEEIREIAKEFLKDLCDDCGWHNTDECNPEGYSCGEMKKIINKINEVLNEKV